MKKHVSRLIFSLIAVILSVCFLMGSGAEMANLAEPLVIDLDLSNMSGTVVYAQVYNMMCDPDSYLGKVIRMAGYYNYFDDQTHDIVYHACIVPDATACCAQGIEFVWAGEHLWPDEYPEIGTDIIVTGRLKLYEEDGMKFLHLVDAELTWNQEIKP